MTHQCWYITRLPPNSNPDPTITPPSPKVCKSYGLPFLGLRALSDTLEGDANADFNAFCQEAADNLYPVVSHVVANV